MGTSHSAVGASSCSRWSKCPGSIRLIARSPAQPSSRYADEGSVAHILAEETLKTYLEQEVICGETKSVRLFPTEPDYSPVGDEVEYGDNVITITEEMCEAVHVYVTTILTDWNKMPTAKLYLEHHFELEDVDAEAYGTVDTCLVDWNSGVIKVYDFKYGRGIVVEVFQNEQMGYYALGALQYLDGAAVNSIELVVVQPRAWHKEGPVRRWNPTIGEMGMFRNALINAINATREPDAPLHAGEHCGFCPAKILCPEIKRYANEKAKIDFAPDKVTVPDPVALTTEELIPLCKAASVVKDLFDQAMHELKRRLEKGEEVKGFKIVKRRSNRRWRAAEEVVSRFEPIAGDTIFKERSLKTPAQLEKLLGKELVAKYSFKPDTGYTISTDSDPRPEIECTKATAEEDFEPI